jgi:phage terminase large subunit GpA-like protein
MTKDKILTNQQQQLNMMFKSIRKVLPKKVLPSVAEWAEENRVLSSKVAAKTGKYKYEYMPYLKEIANRFSKNDSARKIAIMKGVQLGFTTGVFENAIGYSIQHDPCPMMFITADKQLAIVRKRVMIENLIEQSNLSKFIQVDQEDGSAGNNRSGNTATMVEFNGGFLRTVGANNPADLRSFPVKKLFLDEVDGYKREIKGEGNPIPIAVKRTDSYSRTRKVGFISTPTEEPSNIQDYFEKGDQRVYHVPCPFCKKKQELKFYCEDGGEYPDSIGKTEDGKIFKPYGIIFDKQEVLDGNFSSIGYKCKHCGSFIKEDYKRKMLIGGEWVPTARPKEPHFVSYHISALYSPVKEWTEIVLEFIDAGIDPTKLRVFNNQILGLPWKNQAKSIDYTTLSKFIDADREEGVVPDEALFLIGACDVQDDRLELEIKAYGDRFRSWGILHKKIKGDTSDPNDPCWQELFEYKDKMFGSMQLSFLGIDSGDGEKTALIYNLCEKFGEEIVVPLKGLATTIRTTQKYYVKALEKYNIPLIEIYVDLYKNQLSQIFNSHWKEGELFPDGWITFAKSYTDTYMKQLAAEKRIKKRMPNGLIKIEWDAGSRRNEAFDLNVYCLALAEIYIDMHISEDGLQSRKEVFAAHVGD